MKLLGKLPDKFLAEIAGQPDAVRRAAEGLAEQAGAAARIRDAVTRATTVVFTGMGASYNACHVPVTLLAERGVHAVIVDSSELLHFRLPTLSPDTLLVVVSQSGESAEPVALIEELTAQETAASRESLTPRGAPDARGTGDMSAARPMVVAVTNGLDNTIARAADVSLDLHTGAEDGPSTMTFAASIVVLEALFRDGGPGSERRGADIGAGRGAGAARAALAAPHVSTGADALATHLGGLLADPHALADRLVAWLGDRPTLALLGRGCGRAASETGALVLKEAAHQPAEALEAGQFRHGPLELAGPSLAAIVVATEERTRDLDLALAAELAAAGAAVLVVSQRGGAPEGAESLAVGDLPGPLAPAAAIVPAQLLAWRLAGERGLDPCAFSVGRKVTTQE